MIVSVLEFLPANQLSIRRGKPMAPGRQMKMFHANPY